MNDIFEPLGGRLAEMKEAVRVGSIGTAYRDPSSIGNRRDEDRFVASSRRVVAVRSSARSLQWRFGRSWTTIDSPPGVRRGGCAVLEPVEITLETHEFGTLGREIGDMLVEFGDRLPNLLIERVEVTLPGFDARTPDVFAVGLPIHEVRAGTGGCSDVDEILPSCLAIDSVDVGTVLDDGLLFGEGPSVPPVDLVFERSRRERFVVSG